MSLKKIISVLAFTILAACGGTEKQTQQPVHQPSNKNITVKNAQQSQCLSAGADNSSPVSLQLNGSTLVVTDVEAKFNCCLSAWMEVTVQNNKITVIEVEDPNTTMACDCLCLYQLSVEVAGLGTGSYVVEVYHGAATPSALLHQETIQVP